MTARTGCWRDRALCRSLPADWWDLGDVGNRLALTLCRLACPVRAQCAAADPAPCGVIRAGVPWLGTGTPAPVCACGRPIGRPRPTSTRCFTCDPRHDTPLPAARTSRRARPGAVERHSDTIAALAADGWTDRAIAVRLGVKRIAVRGVRRRHRIASQAGPRRGRA